MIDFIVAAVLVAVLYVVVWKLTEYIPRGGG